MKIFAFTALSASLASAYPFLGAPEASAPGMTSSPIRRQFSDDATCPKASDHTGAVPFNPDFPYLGADPKSLKRGTGKGGIEVPAPGDFDHEFRAPGPNDIRGPCPGLNAMANHGFISRDGIVTYTELVSGQQNMFNVGYELAHLLAIFGVGLDGDVVTEKLSLGCDATSRTALIGQPLGIPLQRNPGLNGHNKFEADTSLTRNDYFTHNGDNFRFNGTLFKMMYESTGGDFTRVPLAKYRAERWNQSQVENPNFFFGPGSLLMYGAASFLYALFPGSSHKADLETMKSFFGAEEDANGEFYYVGERIPTGWRNRVEPYNLNGVGGQIGSMYGAHPVQFGANTGPGKFVLFNRDGSFGGVDLEDGDEIMCLLYQLALSGVPSTLTGTVLLPVQVTTWLLGKLNPIFENTGCPLVII